MAYKVIILYQLYMPSYFLGTFTEYPYLYESILNSCCFTPKYHLKKRAFRFMKSGKPRYLISTDYYSNTSMSIRVPCVFTTGAELH